MSSPQYKRQWYLQNRERILLDRKQQRKLHPAYFILKGIKDRCNNPNNNRFKHYGERGIECNITEEEIKSLMIRDGYYNLKNPSIDREDNDGNYTP